MRFALAFAFIFLCIACGGGDSGGSSSGDASANNNHGYGWDYDVQGTSGLKVRWDAPVKVIFRDLRDPIVFETMFASVAACSGLSAPVPPFVIVVAFHSLKPLDNGGGTQGVYYEDPSLIVIDDTLSLFRHESIHYLLETTTGNMDRDHVSPLFLKCS